MSFHIDTPNKGKMTVLDITKFMHDNINKYGYEY